MTIFANRYEIVRKLGEGGMGEVWLAHDKEMSDTLVALKFVRRVLSDDTRALADLRREVINAKKLTDRRIVRIYELMKHNDVYFITMEYVPGEDLNNRLGRYQAEGHVFNLDEVLALAGEICPAMDYAHEQKVLHLDLKPRNIIAVEGGGFKVMDFGIARSAHESMTRVTNAPGYALGYSPPEQISGGEIDRRTDVYSLAATFYDLLAGHPPFWRGDVYRQTLEKPVLPIEGLPAEINTVLLRGLAKNPEERPKTAGMLLEMLEEKKEVIIELEPSELVIQYEPLITEPLSATSFCPICGNYVKIADSFRCKKCARIGICIQHRTVNNLCEECDKEFIKQKQAQDDSRRLEQLDKEKKSKREKAKICPRCGKKVDKACAVNFGYEVRICNHCKRLVHYHCSLGFFNHKRCPSCHEDLTIIRGKKFEVIEIALAELGCELS